MNGLLLEFRATAKSRISRFSEISNSAPQRNLEFRATAKSRIPRFSEISNSALTAEISNSALQRNLEFRATAKSRISRLSAHESRIPRSSEISNSAPQRNLEFRAPVKSRISRLSEISNFALQRNLKFRATLKQDVHILLPVLHTEPKQLGVIPTPLSPIGHNFSGKYQRTRTDSSKTLSRILCRCRLGLSRNCVNLTSR